MKFFASALSMAMLAASFMVHPSSAQGVDIHQAVETQLFNVDGPMNHDELNFLASMWEAAYNIVHEGEPGEQVTIDQVTLESMGGDRRGLRSSGGERKLPWGYGGGVDGRCSLCRRRDLQEDEGLPGDTETLHRRFERKLTTLLRLSPYEYFLDLEDVQVSFPADSSRRALQETAARKTQEGADIHENFEATLANVDGPLNHDEVSFLASMWEAAYNIIHEGEPGEQVTIDAVTIDTQGGDSRALGSSGGERKLPWGYGGGVDGRCSLCRRRNLQEGEGSLPGDTETLHRRFERRLTDFLREGPYEIFQDVEDVTVSIVA